jgi:nucleotide-binding universal stress UspA family protein
MRILVAVDGSSSSDLVIQEVSGRPWPEGSEFQVATVIDPYFFSSAPKVLEEAKESAQKTLEELGKPLIAAGWTVQLKVMLENPRHQLPRAAREWKADLLVIGSHGHGAVRRMLLGSTAQAVLRHAECSVEIVRPRRTAADDDTGMHVMIPTDGSPHAEAVIGAVASRPWPNGSEFEVVSSPEYPVLIGEYPYYAPEQVADLTKRSLEHSKRAVDHDVEQLAKAGLKVRGQVMEPKDTPASSILSAAEEWRADLIVLGSHGRRGFDRLILGSVSETVALHANCSVEVVRIRMPEM